MPYLKLKMQFSEVLNILHEVLSYNFKINDFKNCTQNNCLTVFLKTGISHLRLHTVLFAFFFSVVFSRFM